MKQQGFLKGMARFVGLAEDTTPETLDENSIREWLIDRLAHYAKIERSEVSTSREFEDYGLDSRTAVRVAGDLEKLVERRLSPALLYEQTNIDSLAAWLAEQVNAPDEAEQIEEV